MKDNRCGLVSISFREKSIDELIGLCKDAGIKYIEWGSDVHCPVKDTALAFEIGKKSRDAGLVTYCYGSYFRVGVTPVSEFEDYCTAAKALGAECIRVWAFNKKYSDCTKEEIVKAETEAKEIFAIAKKHGLYVNFEYHRSCLTETIDGALKLFDICDNDVLKVHWQPNPEITAEENMRELSLLPAVDIVHVFAWTYENGENIRHALYNHHLTWKDYIRLAKEKNPDCIFELEFFKDDSFSQCIKDANTLSEIIG